MKVKYFAWVRERIGMASDLRLGHAGIMLESQRGDRFAVLAAAADAAERDDGTHIGAAFRENRDFLRDVEIRLLNANGRRDSHFKTQPPVIGGKNAISRAPDITASGLTWAWSIAARITFGFSKAWA